MYAIRSYYADKAAQAYMAAHEARPIYMEPLIKLATAFGGMDDEKALSYLERLDEIRITSYNVCYTKLLRILSA